MKHEPLTRAPQPKGTTLCPTWFFGGPHQWTSRDRCSMCGITRQEARTLAKFRVQPALGCEEMGHPQPAGWTVIPWPVPEEATPHRLRLAVDNTLTSWPFPASCHEEKA